MQRNSSLHRAGNALIFALGVTAVVAAGVLISATGAIRSVQDRTDALGQVAALGAAEAVLSLREKQVLDRARAGDPAQFSTWTENYGIDFFGNCEVRWRTEPVRSADSDGDPLFESGQQQVNNGRGRVIPFISNPSPDQSWSPPGTLETSAESPATPEPAWKPNDVVYLFRVSVEARYLLDTGKDGAKESAYTARAQGVRYVAVFKEPLFRYVIFYAQKGPLGDLELSHGPAVRIMGNVHSNGSIYVGAGAQALNWDAVRRNNQETQIGPMEWSPTTNYNEGDRVTSGKENYQALASSIGMNPAGGANSSRWLKLDREVRVRVVGAEGIFRLAKPPMYGFFNQFPMSPPTSGGGWQPSGSASGVHYALDGSLQTKNPLAAYDGAGSTVEALTGGGVFVNPYRVLGASQLITRPQGSATTGNDTWRTINGIPLVGDWESEGKGNDSRDHLRKSAQPDKIWEKISLKNPPDGFGGFARSQISGGNYKQLDETLANRPLEAQSLVFRAESQMSPGELQKFKERGPNQELARPVFINPANSALTTDLSGLGNTPIEKPGYYLAESLGNRDFAMKRAWNANEGFEGWKVVNRDGSDILNSAYPVKAGLIIRERPVPDFTYFGLNQDPLAAPSPGYSEAYLPDRTSVASDDFIPYAYGKHKAVRLWPFLEMWVSSQGIQFASLPSGNGDDAMVGIDTRHIRNDGQFRSETYTPDAANRGIVRIEAVVRGGARGFNTSPTTPTPSDDTDATTLSTNPASNLNFANKDATGYFRDNWRFIHLRRASVSDPKEPVADLSTPATGLNSNYVNGSQFSFVQTRIYPDPATNAFVTGGGAGARAGLMVRPLVPGATGATATANLTSSGVNSRDPFLAVTFSPVSGIQTQRRLQRSRPFSVAYGGEWYTATGAAPGITDPGASYVSVHTVDPVDDQYGPPSLVKSYTNRRNPTTGWSVLSSSSGAASTFNMAFTVSTGEGTKTSPSYVFHKGPFLAKRRYFAWKESYWFYSRTRTQIGTDGYQDYILDAAATNYQLGMTTPPNEVAYPNGWSGRQFYIAGPNPTVFGNPIGAAPTNVRDSFPIVNQNMGIAGFQEPTRYRRAFPRSSNDPILNGPQDTFSYKTQWSLPPELQNSYDSDTTIYTNLGQYAAAKSWFLSVGLTESDLRNRIGSSFTYKSVPTSWSYPASSGLPEPADTAVPEPQVPEPTPSTKPTPRPGKYQVAISRKGSGSVRLETNSWISARGSFFPVATATKHSMVLRPGMPEYLDPNYTLLANLPSTTSFRPEYWTGAATPTWASGQNQIVSADGGIEFNTAGFGFPAIDTRINSGSGTGATSNLTDDPPFWEDAPIPRWVAGITYTAGSSIVWYNRSYWVCQSTGATSTPGSNASHWARASHIWLRITKNGNVLTPWMYVGVTSPADADVDPANATNLENGMLAAGWRRITSAVVRNADGMPAASPANQAATIDVQTWNSNWLVGLCAKSHGYDDGGGIDANTSNASAVWQFSNVAFKEGSTLINNTTWEKANQPTSFASATQKVDTTTQYLCSQYQVFWGPLDITEDFFAYTRNNDGQDASRIAREDYFYHPRVFWSMSRWWNEGDIDSAGNVIPRSQWLERETGTTTAPSPWNRATERTLMAKTSIIRINMDAFQDYLKKRTLTEMAYRWSSASYQGVIETDSLSSRWNGLLYVARTNRYPRNPDTTGGANPFNPDLPNLGAADATGHLLDLYRDPTTLDPTKKNVQARLLALDAANRGVKSLPIPWHDFHHGVYIENGANINWAYAGASTKFGAGKMSIITPNALYLVGDFNNTKNTYLVNGVSAQKYTPVAVMGDSITLLSNGANLDNYREQPLDGANGLFPVDTQGVLSTSLGTGPLTTQRGPSTTSPTSFRTCILTNNQPTTKYRAFQDEGAPFINTMLFLENWNSDPLNSTPMNFTGSLVVFDTARYTRDYLLFDPRIVGRSPFGLMGWHVGAAYNGLTGNNTTTHDWAFTGTAPATTALTNMFVGTTAKGSLPVYDAPQRNFSFNDDLLTEDGTPPKTPFGVTAAGVAGWVRAVE